MVASIRPRAAAWLTVISATLAATLAPNPAAAASAAPTAPTDVRVRALGYTDATLVWDDSSDDGWFMYTVEVRAPNYVQRWGALGPTKTLTGLTQGTTYTAWVWAVDTDGNASDAASTQFTVPRDSQPPSAPANLRGVYANGVLQAIAWDPSIDNAPQLIYQLYSAAGWLTATTSTSVTIVDLVYQECVVQPGETYTLTVEARDIGGNVSTRSAPLTVTLPE